MLAQRADQGERPGAIDAAAEGRVDGHVAGTNCILKRLDHDMPVRRDDTQCVQLGPHVCDDVLRRVVVQPKLATQPPGQFVQLAVGGANALGQFAPEAPDAEAEIVRAPGLVAVPERHARQRAGGVAHDHAVVLDVKHTPRLAAQYESIADSRLVHKLFVQFAHARLAVGQIDAVHAAVGNGAGVAHRHQT